MKRPTGQAERGLQVALLLSTLDVVLMGWAASQSTSLTILGDWLKECADGLSVLMSWVTYRLVRGRQRGRYAYGIGKLENLVSLGIAALMLLSAAFISYQAWHHLRDPRPIEGGWLGFGVFVIYAGVGLGIAAMHHRNARREPSPLIDLQVRLFLSKAGFDALMALALGVSLMLPGQAWTPYLDPLAALVGVAFMLHAVWAILSSSVHDLLDVTLNEQMQWLILRCLVKHFDAYAHLHGVRTRRAGPQIFVEVLLEFDPQARMAEVQARAQAIEADILRALGPAQVSIVLSSGANATTRR